jgi:DNA-binding Lrp family transcriptional regulator
VRPSYTAAQLVLMSLAQADAPMTFAQLAGKLSELRPEALRDALRSAERQGFVMRFRNQRTLRYQTTVDGAKVVRLLYAMPDRFAGKSFQMCLIAADGPYANVVARIEVDASAKKILVALVDKRHGALPPAIEAETHLPPAMVFTTLAAMIRGGLVVLSETPKDGDQSGDQPAGRPYVLTSLGYMAATDELQRRKRDSRTTS